jgi:hypothetical protein
VKVGCDIVGGCFTNIVVHSAMSYHQELALPTATEPRRLHKDVPAACGALAFRFHRIYKPESMDHIRRKGISL